LTTDRILFNKWQSTSHSLFLVVFHYCPKCATNTHFIKSCVQSDTDKCIPSCNPDATTAILVLAILLMHNLGQSKNSL
jgi:hypothetical protein